MDDIAGDQRGFICLSFTSRCSYHSQDSFCTRPAMLAILLRDPGGGRVIESQVCNHYPSATFCQQNRSGSPDSMIGSRDKGNVTTEINRDRTHDTTSKWLLTSGSSIWFYILQLPGF